MADEPPFKPVIADKQRQATDAFRGYCYQIWASVYAWTKLGKDEALFLEGAEDFDKYGKQSPELVQIKDTKKSGKITLASSNTLNTINNYWASKKRTSEKIHLRYLTTSEIGREKNSIFDENIKGINLWNLCNGEKTSVGKIRDFLLRQKSLTSEITLFLQNSTEEQVYSELISRIHWDTGNPPINEVKEAVERHLINLIVESGFQASDSIKILPALFERVCEVISTQEVRFLYLANIYEIIAAQLTVSVSQSAIAPLFQQLSSLLGQQENKNALQAVAIKIQKTPPLAPRLLLRESIIEDIEKKITEFGLVSISGLSGCGKTTLIAQYLKSASPVLWAYCRDEQSIGPILRELGNQIDGLRESTILVLDDLNVALSPVEEQYLQGLFYSLKQSRSRIIITSNYTLPQRLASKLGISTDCHIQIPNFDSKEIEDLLILYGCPKKDAEIWAKLIPAQTQGHPQLVHAYISYLETIAFDKSNVRQNILSPPEKLGDSKDEIRRILPDLVTQEACELLYRLSPITGFFKRNTALKVGEIPTELKGKGFDEIKLCGDVFDKLVGPWIERISNEHFRISPLLQNAASKVWGEEKIELLNIIIGRSFLGIKSIDQYDFGAALFHAFMGKDSGVLIRLVQCFQSCPKKAQLQLADFLSWFTLIGVKELNQIFPGNLMVNLMLRTMQFQMAILSDAKQARIIADIWDRETKQFEENEPLRFISRSLLISYVAVRPELEYSLTYLIGLLVELKKLSSQISKIERKKISDSEKQEVLNTLDKGPSLFLYLTIKCSSPANLKEIIQSLQNVDSLTRDKLLSKILSSEADTSLWIDRAGTSLFKEQNPDWEECIKILEEARDAALQWGYRILAASAQRAILIVLNEHIRDSKRAKAVLATLINEYSDFVTVQDAIANYYFLHEDYPKALEIWEKILFEQTVVDTNNLLMFSYRKAASAASKQDNWPLSSKFLFKGYSKNSSSRWKDGYYADYCFSLWKEKQYGQAIDGLAVILKKLEKQKITSEQVALFVLNKLVGCMLLWMDEFLGNNNSPELPVGMCSNPDYDPTIKELPNTPIEYSWAHLLLIEHALKLGDKHYTEKAEKLLRSKYPLVHAIVLRINLENAYKANNLGDILYIHRQEIGDILASKSINITVESDISNYEYTDSDKAQLDACLLGLLLAASLTITANSTDLAFSQFLPKWNAFRGEFPEYKMTAGAIEAINNLQNDVGYYEITGDLKDYKGSAGKRLVAAVTLLGRDDTQPDDLFYAHSFLLIELIKIPKRTLPESDIEKLITMQWAYVAENQSFYLRAPKISADLIKAACKDNRRGYAKAAYILLQVENAVSVRLPDEWKVQFKNLSSGTKQ